MTRPASSGDRRLKSWASPSLGASPCRLERVEELLKNFTPSLLRVNDSRFSNIFIEKRESFYPESLAIAGLFYF